VAESGFSFIIDAVRLRAKAHRTASTRVRLALGKSVPLVLCWNGNYAIPKRQLMQQTRTNDR